MLKCPIKTTQEYQDILKETNGNEERARELWIERGFEDNDDLNEYEKTKPSTAEDPEDNRGDKLSSLVDKMRLYVAKEIQMLNSKKFKKQEVIVEKKKKLLETLNALDGVDSINMFVKDAFEKAKDAEKKLNISCLLISSNIE